MIDAATQSYSRLQQFKQVVLREFSAGLWNESRIELNGPDTAVERTAKRPRFALMPGLGGKPWRVTSAKLSWVQLQTEG
jgi:hypothetical protein